MRGIPLAILGSAMALISGSVGPQVWAGDKPSNRGYIVGQGGSARLAEPGQCPQISNQGKASTNAPITVNEEGLEGAAPIGVNEPGVSLVSTEKRPSRAKRRKGPVATNATQEAVSVGISATQQSRGVDVGQRMKISPPVGRPSAAAYASTGKAPPQECSEAENGSEGPTIEDKASAAAAGVP